MWRSNANELKQRHWSITQADGTTVNDKKHQTVNLHKSRMGVKKQATRNKPDRNEHLFLIPRFLKTITNPNLPPWSQINHVRRHTGKHSFEHTCACRNCSCKTKESFYKNSPARRLNRSKIVSEPSASKTELAYRSNHDPDAADIIYKHNNMCISSLKGDKLTREGLKSTWNYVFFCYQDIRQDKCWTRLDCIQWELIALHCSNKSSWWCHPKMKVVSEAEQVTVIILKLGMCDFMSTLIARFGLFSGATYM